MTSSRQSSAWDEGQEAYRCGIDMADNPYPPLTPDFARWAAGWRDLEEHFTNRDLVIEWR